MFLLTARTEFPELRGLVLPQFANTLHFRWLTGRDGEVWVWVMGEHSDDKPIDQIIEDETKRKAREIAENEVQTTVVKMSKILLPFDKILKIRF